MIKIKKSDADFIIYGFKKYGGDKEQFFNSVVSTMTLWNKDTEKNISSNLTPYELAKVLFEGYEVELTPNEQIEALYYDYIRNMKVYLANSKLNDATYLEGAIHNIEEINRILKLGLDLR